MKQRKNNRRWFRNLFGQGGYVREEKAEVFVPHRFEPQVRYQAGIPHILITQRAYSAMWHIVDLSREEVSWLGTVKDVSGAGSTLFRIEEIFIFKQEVSAVTTAMNPEGLAALAGKILDTRADGVDVINALRFWGHSHVHMDTSPSGQDDHQMDIFASSDHPYFIRGILNKRGRAQFTVYFYETGIVVYDVPWSVESSIDAEQREGISAELREKVRPVRAMHVSHAGVARLGLHEFHGPQPGPHEVSDDATHTAGDPEPDLEHGPETKKGGQHDPNAS